MSRRRKKPRERQRSDILPKRKDQFLPVLEKLGVAREFEQLPTWMKEGLYLKKCPRPTVVLDAQATQDRRASDVKAAVDNGLDNINAFELDVPALDAQVSIAEFFMCVEPLCELLRIPETVSKYPDLAPLANRLQPILKEPAQLVRFCVLLGLQFVLSGYSRIDTALFHCQYESKKLPNVRYSVHIHVHKYPARVTRIKRPGRDSTKAFQAGGGLTTEDFEWIEWNPADVGLRQPDDQYPVLVSSHALRRYEDRVPFAAPGGRDPDYFHNSINISLHQPEVAKMMPDGTLLVTHYIMDYRVGYWCFRLDGRQFVADTFLFLTMEGTPEGDQLWSKLRMRRADREWTDLDKLETFLTSDVRGDNELMDIFTECGCGHLFELAKKLQLPQLITGSAASIREHLGSERLERALARVSNKPQPRTGDRAPDAADDPGTTDICPDR